MSSVLTARFLIQLAIDSVALYEQRQLTLTELAAASCIPYSTLYNIQNANIDDVHTTTYLRLKSIVEGRYLH